MKNKHYLLLILLMPVFTHAQDNTRTLTQHQLDSLHIVFEESDNDTLKMAISRQLGTYYTERDRDTTIYFSKRFLELSKKLGQPIWQASSLATIAYKLRQKGEFPEALRAAMDGLELISDESSEHNMINFGIHEDPHKMRISTMARLIRNLAQLHRATGNNEKAIQNFLLAIRLSESVDHKQGLHHD